MHFQYQSLVNNYKLLNKRFFSLSQPTRLLFLIFKLLKKWGQKPDELFENSILIKNA